MSINTQHHSELTVCDSILSLPLLKHTVYIPHNSDILLIMVTLCNTADHYIFTLWFLLLLFLPHLISASVDWMSTILLHMVWP